MGIVLLFFSPLSLSTGFARNQHTLGFDNTRMLTETITKKTPILFALSLLIISIINFALGSLIDSNVKMDVLQTLNF